MPPPCSKACAIWRRPSRTSSKDARTTPGITQRARIRRPPTPKRLLPSPRCPNPSRLSAPVRCQKELTPSSVTVSKDRANRYFISILLEEDMEALPRSSKRSALISDSSRWWLSRRERSSATRSSSPQMKSSWRVPNASSLAKSRAARTGPRRVTRSPDCTLGSRTRDVIFSTNSRPASSVRTKRCASRRWR
jgi:hypothetical protein